MLVVIAMATAGAVTLAGGGAAFWLSTPAALLACALARTWERGLLGAATVVLAGVAPFAIFSHLGSLPAPAMAILVPTSSALVITYLRVKMEGERDTLRRTALTDPLTRIANRRALLGRIDYEIARHARLGHSFVIVMIDLDGFKTLNDRFGHAAGDELLVDVASALKRTLRGQDTAARMGGDEFCVLAPETEPHGAEQLEARVQATVARFTAASARVQASTGYASFPQDGTSAPALLAVADRRMLDGKLSRRRQGALPERRAA